MARPGIMVATPAYGGLAYMPYMSGMLELQNACRDAGIGFDHFWLANTALLHEQRNVAVERFMRQSDLSHLMFIDADVGFRAEDVLRMFALGHDLALGLYPAKHMNWRAIVNAARMRPDLSPAQIAAFQSDFSSVFYGIEGQETLPLDAAFEIHAGGTGLMLIAREVFEKMESHFPQSEIPLPDAFLPLLPGGTHMWEHFEFLRGQNGRALSEDISFCQKWRETGGRIYGCTWFKTVHCGLHLFQGDLPALLGS